MKNLLLSACAAAIMATAAASASADDYTIPDDGPGSIVIRVGDNRDNRDNRHYNDPYGNEWPYQQPGNPSYDDDWDHNQQNGWGYGQDDNRHSGWGNGWGNQWGNGWGQDSYHDDVVPPRVIVRQLYRRNFTYITRPVLAGRFYQVKAIAPNGRKVKLYIDAYSGRIVKAKYRS